MGAQPIVKLTKFSNADAKGSVIDPRRTHNGVQIFFTQAFQRVFCQCLILRLWHAQASDERLVQES